MRFRLLPVTDLIFFVLFPALFVVLTIIGTLTPGNSPQGIVISWLACCAWISISVLKVYERRSMRSMLHYVTKHGIYVGWTKPDYEVAQEMVERQVDRLLSLLEDPYPSAPEALRGCVVLFREPSWVQLSTGRRISGEQDHTIIVVGWNIIIDHTALQHELAHRILQIGARDPDEATAHELMEEYGL